LARHFNAEELPEIVSLYEKKHLARLKNEFREALKKAITDDLPKPEVYLQFNLALKRPTK